MSSDEPVAIVSSPRVSFFDEQARRRSEAHWLSAACLVVASGIGIALSIVITPLLLILAGAVLRLLAGLHLLPEMARSALHALARWTAAQIAAFFHVIDSLDGIHRLSDIGVTLGPLSGLSPLCLPGLIAAALLWILLRSINSRIGGEDLVLRLGCRQPDPLDLEERQLANIVEEMAVAAGLPTPRLLLIDTPLITAAAVGRSHRSATILVTRGLIDDLDRRESSGIVAHLVASIVQGDSGLSVSVLAVLQTLGCFLTILDLPLRWSASRALGGLILVALGLRRSPDAVARVGEMLEDGLRTSSIDPVQRILNWAEVSHWRVAVIAPLLPFILVSLFMKMVLFLWTTLLLALPLGLLWRNRRYSADALAVQLIRDPDALALGLRKIAGSSLPAGATGREYFFIHAPIPSTAAASLSHQSLTTSLHPTMARRLRRLDAMGATEAGTASMNFWNVAEIMKHPARSALVAGLLLLLIPLFAALGLAAAYLSAMLMTIVVAMGLALASFVLGG